MIGKEWEIQLKQLEGELILMKDSIRETALDIIKEGFSAYPVFVAHTGEVKIGEVILDKADMATSWSISASTMEEFLEKGLISPEKGEYFRTNYKNPEEFICLFVVHNGSANFVFVPYRSNLSGRSA
jgi:hypothetical protein